MLSDKNFDVVIIGTGITGLSTALHLQAMGVERIGLSGPDPLAPALSAGSAGMAAGGQHANYTRVSNAHGLDFAKALWVFGDQAFDALQSWCVRSGVDFRPSRRVRLITSVHELRESTEAVRQMTAAGFKSDLMDRAGAHPYFETLQDRILAIQDDGPRGAWVDADAVLSTLMKALVRIRRLPPVCAREPRSVTGGLALSLADGGTIYSEVVVVAAHLASAAFLPGIAPALVRVADQWTELQFPAFRLLPPWLTPGISFSMNHNLEWGVTRPDGGLSLGGGRYLRIMGGVDVQDAEVDLKITEHLRHNLMKSIDRKATSPAVIRTLAGVDCIPCDELPIIGPMFGDSRVLLAVGFMGQGLTQGFFAGRCLAKLITEGAADALPRRLWPERLRSLG